jgi:hypothetical protein
MDTETPDSRVGTPLEAVAVAREESEGNTMVAPPRACKSEEVLGVTRRIRRIQRETMLNPEWPTGA